MLRPALFAGLFALATAAPAALVLTIDSSLSIVRPAAGSTTFWILGLLDDSTVSTTAQASSASIPSLSVTGPVGFTQADATVYDGVLGGFNKGKYTGKLFGLPISATTPLGTYTGTVKMQVRFGSRTTPVTTGAAPFSFTVTAAQAVPEPAGLAAMGVGLLTSLRRRRR